MISMIFEPSEVLSRVNQKIEDSFYLSLNGPKTPITITPSFPLTEGMGRIVGVSGFIGAASGISFTSRKEPSPFWSKIDQFQHIEDRVSQRNNSFIRLSPRLGSFW